MRDPWRTVDLNADVGESFGRWRLGDDGAVLAAVTSANVACGFHAGDPTTLLATCRAAVRAGVAVGAQVGYRDLPGFGRRFIDVAAADLHADVLYQLSALAGLARVAGGRLAHVKPHGALYHACSTHPGQARAVLDAVTAFDPTLPVLAAAGSPFLAAVRGAGLTGIAEVFADRGYAADGTLLPRTADGAVLSDAEAVVERVLRMVRDGEVVAADGTVIAVEVESVCLHGDTPGAAALTRQVRDALTADGIVVAAPALDRP